MNISQEYPEEADNDRIHRCNPAARRDDLCSRDPDACGYRDPGGSRESRKVARNYKVPMLKVTSGQRIALVGLSRAMCRKRLMIWVRWQSPKRLPVSSSCSPVSARICANTATRTQSVLQNPLMRCSKTRRSRPRSRSGSRAAPAAAVRAIRGISGSWARTGAGRSFLAATGERAEVCRYHCPRSHY